ncbi:MAG: (2Fe-2S)-binding protein, partial [candidate division NC10 bacterium]|nr:(2Fe-2S)-binding protein [candidate division NC10 bacterium]
MRIEGGPTVVERGEPFQMEVDGQSIVAFEGETIATALLASGRRVFRHTARTGTPRGLFCGIGVCFE